MYCHSINRPTFSFLMGWGESFWVNLVLPELFFSTPSFIMNFFLEHFLASDVFFFCLQHGEVTTIIIILQIQFLQHSNISERFESGWGLSEENYRLLHENLMLCQKQKIPDQKNWTYVRKLSKFSLVTKFGDFIMQCLLNCTTENLRRFIYGIVVLSLFL